MDTAQAQQAGMMGAPAKLVAVGTIGSVAGAVFWSQHRVLGFIAGGVIASLLYSVFVIAPRIAALGGEP